jgi:arylamine N-acetyltransferase
MRTDHLSSYLRRLELDAPEPTVEALFALHRAQVERIPYETTWIHLGEVWDIDVAGSLRRIATEGRGGYCFHLNGAFASLLRHVGYRTTLHVGGPHGPDGATADDLTSHLAVTVEALPTAANPGGRWLVDAGLGDGLHEPLPLVAGTYVQGTFTFRLDPAPGPVGDWRLTHDPRGSFPAMTFCEAPATMTDFAARHRHLSTSPESGFVRTVTAQRRDADGADVLRGLVLARIDAPERTGERVIAGRSEWFDTLEGRVGLDLRGTTAAARDRLWASAQASHRAWLQARAAKATPS